VLCAVENSAEHVQSIQFAVARRGARSKTHMLLIVGAVVVLSGVVIISRMRVPGGVNARTLGWMSDKWLAEHRASHSR